jgi:hypothetical protein
MTFTDAKLQQHVERVAASATGLPSEQRLVCGLLDAYQFFQLTEGEQSLRVGEAVQKLLSVQLRPALRNWYRSFGDDMNANAIAFRDRLSELAGERFG